MELDCALAEQVCSLVAKCQQPCGGFAPHPGHAANLLSTLSAVHIAFLLGKRSLLGGPQGEKEIERYLLSLQLPDGSFHARQAALDEGDCRFVYAALCGLALLRKPSEAAEDGIAIETSEITAWLLGCQNLDGGFGCRPDGECESHAGHTFCCLASLALTGGLQQMDLRKRGRLVRWLSARQCKEGGLNGRPGKAPDACYTWWTCASAELLGKCPGLGERHRLALSELFKLAELSDFVKRCMSPDGGVAAHPGDDPDPFHTFFGLAGLSLIQYAQGGESATQLSIGQISPLLALPLSCLENGSHEGYCLA
eukprot:TRINITY_DN11588_c2_g1_i2.p1 TRINITY_DN11588_c2_g1~~TRINITY_DN11588_c2_g1_i2.p1  ORF type:complete len:310 (-),score=30.06 TRINITY_DN11588_c2_g1_i2:144-1073(-)